MVGKHMSHHVDATLAEHRAALQQVMGAMKGAIAETITHLRDEVCSLEAGIQEKRRLRSNSL